MKFKNLALIIIKCILWGFLLGFQSAWAHVISISATTPFPSSLAVGSTASAVFTVTNLTSRVPLTIVNKSTFPASSGLSNGPSTCVGLLAPKNSCQITVLLNATAPQVVQSSVKVAASPTIDGVEAPFNVSITESISRFIVTPSAGSNGSISPSTPQTVTSGSSIVFTATPDTNYGVGEWLLDGVLAQSGGSTFTLSNITANHTVTVTFTQSISRFTVTPSAGSNGSISPSTPQTVTSGSSIVFTATPDTNYGVGEWLLDGVLAQNGGSTFTLSNITANHTVTVTFVLTSFLGAAVGTDETLSSPLIFSTADGTTWNSQTIPSQGPGTGSNLVAVKCTGTIVDGVCVSSGNDGITGNAFIAVSQNNGANWNEASLPSLPGGSSLQGLAALGTGSSALLVATGFSSSAVTSPLLYVSTDGGSTWVKKTIGGTAPVGNIFFGNVSCTGTGFCAAVGSYFDTSSKLLIAVTQDGGSTWTYKTVTGQTDGALFQISCTGGSYCAATAADGASNLQIIITTDSGNTWTQLTVPGLVAIPGTFTGMSCTGSGSDIICAAVGTTTLNSSIIVSSNRGGTAFSVQFLSSGLDGQLNSVSCVENTEALATCVAAGTIFVTSNDGNAAVWNSKNSSFFTNNLVINSVRCLNNGTTTFCYLAGTGADSFFNDIPTLAQSNGIDTLSLVTVAGFSDFGQLNSISTTQLSSKIKRPQEILKKRIAL